jgi:hypothetical protein
MLFLGILLLLTGWAAWSLGRRGLAVGLHPICAHCSFDLFGLPEDRRHCPECGADILADSAVLLGHRRPLRAPMAAGLAIALLGAGLTGTAAVRGYLAWDASPYKPLRWLVADVDSPDFTLRRRTCTELQTRMAHSRLSQPELQQVADKVLTLQADRTLTWDPHWGDLLQAAHARRPSPGSPVLAPAAWQRYLSQAPDLAVRIRPRVRTDDPIPLEVTCRLRAGTDYQNMGHIELSLDAAIHLGKLTGTLQGRATSLDQVPLPTTWSLLWLPGAADTQWPDGIPTGVQSADVAFTLTARDFAGTTAMRKQTFSLPLEVLARGESSVRLVKSPPASVGREMADAIRWRGLDDGRGNSVLRQSGARLWISGPPVCAAFRVVLRQNGREWGLARLMVRSNDAALVPLEFAPAISGGLQNGPAEIVCLPDPGMAVGTVDVLEVWGESLHRDLTVQR